MNCLNIAEDLRVSMKFLRTVNFSSLVGFWKTPKPVRPLSFFIRLNVICFNYGRICNSEEFYEKESWTEFEEFLLVEGWQVVGENLFCPSCYLREIDE